MRAVFVLIFVTGLAGLSPVSVGAEVTVAQLCAELRLLGSPVPPSCPAPAEPTGMVGDATGGATGVSAGPLAVTASGALTQEIRESHIFFASGGVALDEAAQAQLGQLIAVLETPPLRDACLRLVGHSDISGGADINFGIAGRRAEAVATVLRAGLADPARIREVESRGEEAPLIGLDPESVQQRRVAILARRCPLPGGS